MNGWLLTLLITAGILGILLLLRFGLRVEYREGEIQVYLCIGWIRVKVYSSIKKKLKNKKREQKPKHPNPKKQEVEKPKRSFRDVLTLVHALSGIAARLLKRVRVEVLEGRITVCGTDAATAAIAYGRMWGVVGAAHALLDNLVTLRNFAVDVVLDYDGNKTQIEGAVEIRFCGLYILAAIYGMVKALKGSPELMRKSGGSPRKLAKEATVDAISQKDAAH